jgi:hypothetical protein
LLIDIDSETNFLRHFLHSSETRLSLPERRRNVLAALIATGCNIGPQRMAAASGISLLSLPAGPPRYRLSDRQPS